MFGGKKKIGANMSDSSLFSRNFKDDLDHVRRNVTKNGTLLKERLKNVFNNKQLSNISRATAAAKIGFLLVSEDSTDKEAKSYLNFASESGNADAMYLNYIYLLTSDNKMALKWLEKAAEAKYQRAVLELARVYDRVKGDYKSAAKWYYKYYELYGEWMEKGATEMCRMELYKIEIEMTNEPSTKMKMVRDMICRHDGLLTFQEKCKWISNAYDCSQKNQAIEALDDLKHLIHKEYPQYIVSLWEEQKTLKEQIKQIDSMLAPNGVIANQLKKKFIRSITIKQGDQEL